MSLSPAEIDERVAVVIAAEIMKDREATEAIRSRHRTDKHGGVSSEQCEFCGFLDAAVYQVQTGSSLAKDFLPREPQEGKTP